MGTVLEVAVVADEEPRARQLAERCLFIAERWEGTLTTWRSDGELARLNAHAGKGPTTISPDLVYALQRMLALQQTTDNAFNPAVGSIVFALRSGRPPPQTDRRAQELDDVLMLQNETAELPDSVQLDAGGIGKGLALDAIDEMLRREKADAWFLNFGGSSQLAHGRPPGEQWIVGIAGLKTGHAHGMLVLRDASLSTSRSVPASEPSGTIVDPRTGGPVVPARSVTVLAPDATSADAWSTALIVLGREGVPAAHADGIEVLYEDAEGTVVTSAFPLERRVSAQTWPAIRPRSPHRPSD